MTIPGEVIEAAAGWAVGVRDRLPAGSHVVVVGARSSHCLEGRQAGLAFRDTIAVATGQGFTLAALFRLPFEGTVAEQVLKTGTGGLWIDGCRISTSRADAKALERCNTSGSGRMYASESPIGTFTRSSSSGALDTTRGRWPTNIVFVHEPGCRSEGMKRVRSTSGGAGVYDRGDETGRAFNQCNATVVTNFKGEDGLETVPAWICEPGCPVAALDEMSLAGGMHSAGFSRGGSGARTGQNESMFAGDHEGNGARHGDSGGASRFYPQFEDRSALTAWLGRLIYGASPV
jgi:hypothetical protein